MNYAVTVSDSFEAKHYLTVPDSGPESELHPHTFGVEATFRGSELGAYGYLLDIDDAIAALETITDRYRHEKLNEYLEGNPSCERLAEAIYADIRRAIDAESVDRIEVRIHEDDTATVTYAGPA